ncbi:MAG: hypothetical protein O2894_11245 [Planctomycetota bacterium]|nr:hypothetical protein [Planctomycetota bacterium]
MLALAHVGLFYLLTREARAGLGAAEGRHLVSKLESATAPDGQPAPGTQEYSAWREANALWIDASAWRNDRRQIALMRGGTTASFVLQAAVTGWVLARVLGRRRR